MADRDGLKPAAYAVIVEGAWHDAKKHEQDAKESGFATGKRFDLLPMYFHVPASPQPAPHAIAQSGIDYVRGIVQREILGRRAGRAEHGEIWHELGKVARQVDERLSAIDLFTQPAAVEPAKPVGYTSDYDLLQLSSGTRAKVALHDTPSFQHSKPVFAAPSPAVAEPHYVHGPRTGPGNHGKGQVLFTNAGDCKYWEEQPARKSIDAQGAEVRDLLSSIDNLEAAALHTYLTQNWMHVRPSYPTGLMAWAQQALIHQASPLPAATLGKEFDVRTILLDVVPDDDGVAREIYARNTSQVVTTLTLMSDQIEYLKAALAQQPAASDVRDAAEKVVETFYDSVRDSRCLEKHGDAISALESLLKSTPAVQADEGDKS